MLLENRVDLIIEKIKLTTGVQITTVDSREIQLRYFLDKDILTEVRSRIVTVMLVMAKGGIIYFEIFKDQKLRKMMMVS